MANFDIGPVLDAAKIGVNAPSDYALSRVLNLTKNAIYNYRNGTSLPDPAVCQKLADAAGIDALVLVAQVQAARVQDEATAALWSRIAYRLERGALACAPAIFITACATLFGASDADAMAAIAGWCSNLGAFELLYIASFCASILVLFGNTSHQSAPWVPKGQA